MLDSEEYLIVDNLYKRLVNEIFSIMTTERKNKNLQLFTTEQVNDFINSSNDEIYSTIDSLISNERNIMSDASVNIRNTSTELLRDYLFDNVHSLDDDVLDCLLDDTVYHEV